MALKKTSARRDCCDSAVRMVGEWHGTTRGPWGDDRTENIGLIVVEAVGEMRNGESERRCRGMFLPALACCMIFDLVASVEARPTSILAASQIILMSGRRHPRAGIVTSLRLRGGHLPDNIATVDVDMNQEELRSMHFDIDKDVASIASRCNICAFMQLQMFPCAHRLYVVQFVEQQSCGNKCGVFVFLSNFSATSDLCCAGYLTEATAQTTEYIKLQTWMHPMDSPLTQRTGGCITGSTSAFRCQRELHLSEVPGPLPWRLHIWTSHLTLHVTWHQNIDHHCFRACLDTRVLLGHPLKQW